MTRLPRQKQKLLYLQKILLEQTDEEHGLTINEIISRLNTYGISAERKSLYDDLKILEICGTDVCHTKDTAVRYYVGSRDFELPELKLLVDAIQSSKFITKKKSLSLINKLEGLVSVYDGKQLQRQVYVANRVKTLNEKIYYNVDKLHNAVTQKKQITFKYFKWVLDYDSIQKVKKEEKRPGSLYNVSPWALCWDDENYYLIAYDKQSDMIKHYRVDKMESIEITDNDCEGRSKFEGFDIAGYTTKVFSMFGGTKADVKLSVDNDLIGVFIDRFGTNVFLTRESDKRFCANVDVVLSPQFYAWLFGLGDKIKLLSPQYAVDEFKNQAQKIISVYLP